MFSGSGGGVVYMRVCNTEAVSSDLLGFFFGEEISGGRNGFYTFSKIYFQNTKSIVIISKVRVKLFRGYH